MKTPYPILVTSMAAILTLQGCLSSKTVTSSATGSIPRSASIAIHTPADGSFEGESYPGTGREVANELKGALIRYVPKVEITETSNTDFTIRPTILRWEDRATEWSGRPDRVNVSLQVYNRRGALIDASVVDGKSSYWTLGGDHPSMLLHQPFAEYARRLVRAP